MARIQIPIELVLDNFDFVVGCLIDKDVEYTSKNIKLNRKEKSI